MMKETMMKETICGILFIGIVMVCLAANSFSPAYDKDGSLAKTCAIVIVALAVLFGLASL